VTAAVITIGIDPYIDLGPVTIAWHGLTIALGILVGGAVAAADARRRGLDPDRINAFGMIAVVAAIVGARVFYLAEQGRLDEPGEWLGTQGFTFYGGFVAAAIAIAIDVARRRLDLEYLDALAVGLPLGIAVGRIGDVINGEHYGPPTDFFLGVRNTHPDAGVPSPALGYHSGGLYEVLIGAVVFVIALSLRSRLRRPTAMVWLVLGLLAAGRFLEFFVRSDSDTLALGLETAQWTSVVLMAVAAVGAWRLHRTPQARFRRRTRRRR